jgi:hypothetical protein
VRLGYSACSYCLYTLDRRYHGNFYFSPFLFLIHFPFFSSSSCPPFSFYPERDVEVKQKKTKRKKVENKREKRQFPKRKQIAKHGIENRVAARAIYQQDSTAVFPVRCFVVNFLFTHTRRNISPAAPLWLFFSFLVVFVEQRQF